MQQCVCPAVALQQAVTQCPQPHILTFTERHYMSLVRKPDFCICENKDADQLRGNSEADQGLCFHYKDSTIPLLPKSEIQASRHLLWLYSLVCVGPGRKPRRLVFIQRGSYSHKSLVFLKTTKMVISDIPALLTCNRCFISLAKL